MAKHVNKRFENSYANYVKRYKAKKAMLEKKGYSMASDMMNKREYKRILNLYKAEGIKKNINQTIVADQTYEYSLKTAQQFKKTAKEFDLEWKDKSITELRKGGIDVSAINERLKELHADWSGIQRQEWISYEVFGSE